MPFPAPGGECAPAVFPAPRPSRLDKLTGWKFLVAAILAFHAMCFAMFCACLSLIVGSTWLLHALGLN